MKARRLLLVPLGVAALAAISTVDQRSAQADANCNGPGEKPTTPAALIAWCAVPANVASACGQSPKRKAECQYATPAKQYLDAQRATRTFFPGTQQRSKLDEPGAQTYDPQTQVTGSYHPYAQGDATFKNRTPAHPAALPAIGVAHSFSIGRMTDWAQLATRPTDPSSWTANPAWEQDGTRVGDARSTPTNPACGEYVYKQFYDWSRFEDSIAACKGDYVCEFDMAYGWPSNAPPSTAATAFGPDRAPRIARRTLMDKDSPSKPLPPDKGATGQQQLPLLEGGMSKNGWFAAVTPYFTATGNALVGVGGMWVDPGDPTRLASGDVQLKWLAQYFPAQYAQDFADLGQALADGFVFYHLKGPGAPQPAAGTNEVYDDEWQFHAAMRGKTANITEEGAAELERRTHRVKSLAAKSTFEYTHTGAQYLAGGQFDYRPWEKYEIDFTLGADPFVQNQALRDYQTARAAVGQNLALNFAPASKIGGNAIVPAAGGAAPPPVAPMMMSGTAAPPQPKMQGWTADPSSPTPRFVCQLGTNVLGVPPAPAGYRQGWQATDPSAPAAAAFERCKMFNAVLDEWFRRKRNMAQPGGCKDNTNCGCLHIGNGSYGCDWSPQQFSERWVKPGHYMMPRSKDMNTCRKYAPYATHQSEDSVTHYKDRVIDAGKDQYKVIAKLPTIDNAPLAFGASAHDDPYFGDKDFFAAGYSYDVGWALSPAKLTDGANPKVCQMSGDAHAYFSADAWLFGDHVSVIDADAWMKANEKNDRRVDYETHLRILGTELTNYGIPSNPGSGDTYKDANAPHDHDAVNVATTCANHDACESHTLKTSSWGDSTDVPTVHPTISMGPCPFCVNGSVWATIGYGATLTPKITLDKGCDHQSRDFGVEVDAVPYASLGGDVEVSVGIPLVCSVGVLGELTLADIHLPVRTSLDVTEKPDPSNHNTMTPALDFNVGVDATFATLGGRLALDFQFLFSDTQVEIFKWKGLGPYKEEIVKPIESTLFLPALDTYAIVNRNSVTPHL